MRQRKYSFIVVLLMIFHKTAQGQFENNSLPYEIQPVKSYIHSRFGVPDAFRKNRQFRSNKAPEKKLKNFLISRDFYQFTNSRIIMKYESRAFFCRQELRLEKLTSVLFRLRLGSVDYVDYLEQKPNSVNPNR